MTSAGPSAPGSRGVRPLATLLVRLAVQSLRAHRNKSLVVGGLMGFSAFVVVVALAVLDSVQQATRAAIVQSLSGDLQVYAKDAQDPLALLGGMGFGTDEIGEIPDVAPVLSTVRAVPEVAAAVPMGIVSASVSSPGDLDRLLTELRAAVQRGDVADQRALLERVQAIARVIHGEELAQQKMTDSADPETLPTLLRVMDAAFPDAFAADPLATLDWLDARLAPLGEPGGAFFFRMIGTDLPLFRESFPRLRIIEGEMVPDGMRGVLVGKSMVDNRIKLPIAIALDQIKSARDRGTTIAEDRTLQETIARMERQSSRILTLIAPRDVPDVERALAAALPPQPGATEPRDLAALVRELVRVDDATFDARYRTFYEVVAPRIQLYPFRVGDTITLTAFTRSGFMKSVNVKVWGIYTIDGLESSDLAGVVTLSDLVTFRDLYGARDAAFNAELAQMRADVKAKAVTRATVEDELFGAEPVEEERAPTPADASRAEPNIEKRALQSETFDPTVQHSGLGLTVAVVLRDPTRASDGHDAVAAAVAPLELQAVDWQDAVGVLGQMSLVVTAVLAIAIAILFLVTIVILNNSLVMATLERIGELGTLRAIGAQRGFIRWMVVLEATLLGVLASLLGALAGILAITWLHTVGIPAPNQILEAVFGGPRLFPSVQLVHVAIALGATTLVGVLATLYPAHLATRVAPIVAMQAKE